MERSWKWINSYPSLFCDGLHSAPLEQFHIWGEGNIQQIWGIYCHVVSCVETQHWNCPQRLWSCSEMRKEPGPHPGLVPAPSPWIQWRWAPPPLSLHLGAHTWMCNAYGDMNDWATNPFHYARLLFLNTLCCFSSPSLSIIPHWKHSHP